MRFFVDTSALLKKYIDEPGADQFTEWIQAATQLIVSPVTWIEMNSAIERRVRDHSISQSQAHQICSEAQRDFQYFQRVLWNDNLESEAVKLVRKHALRTMDAVQLAAGLLSRCDVFITSDRRLALEARKIISRVRLIEA